MKAIELHKVILDDETWRWTSGDKEITYLGEVYTPATISRSSIEQNEEINRANVSFVVPRDNPVGLLYISQTPDHVASWTIFRQQYEDGVPTTLVYWKGRIAGAKASNSQIEISCESVFTSLRRFGVRERYQRNCRHALYHRGCNLNRDNFVVPGIASSASGAVVTVAAAAGEADGWYTGGMIEFGGVFRFIVNHVGSTLTLQRAFDDLNDAVAGAGWNQAWNQYWNGHAAVNIYPGCDRSRLTCKDKFDNILNNGSFGWIPERSPFDGRSIV